MKRRDFLKGMGLAVAGAGALAAIPVAGADVIKALEGIEPAFEDENYSYIWYCKSELEVRQDFEDRMEAELLFGETQPAIEFPHNQGVIIKDTYEVTGSDMTEICWVKIPKK